MDMTVKMLVKNTMAEFVCYRDGELWYRIELQQDGGVNGGAFSFEFPVPVVDTGSGIFPVRVKAITLMRWVRKQFERVQSVDWG